MRYFLRLRAHRQRKLRARARFYHPPTKPEFQALKHKLEHEWVPAVQQLLEIDTESLPILWDCDFLLGPKKNGEDTYVLCEINVSSVAPYPESAVSYIVDAATAQRPMSRQRRDVAHGDRSNGDFLLLSAIGERGDDIYTTTGLNQKTWLLATQNQTVWGASSSWWQDSIRKNLIINLII